MTNLEKTQIQELRSKGHSFSKIAEEVGLSVNTVKSFFRRGEMVQQQPVSKPTVHCDTCLNCGTPLTQKPRTRQKKFCSDKCRMNWWNAHMDQVNHKAMYNFICAGCGRNFQAYGNNHRKYCSHRCYITARFGGDDDNEYKG